MTLQIVTALIAAMGFGLTFGGVIGGVVWKVATLTMGRKAEESVEKAQEARADAKTEAADAAERAELRALVAQLSVSSGETLSVVRAIQAEQRVLSERGVIHSMKIETHDARIAALEQDARGIRENCAKCSRDVIVALTREKHDAAG